MYYGIEKPEVTALEEADDLAKLEALTARAAEVQAKVLDLKRELVAEFMTFSEERLGKYEYNYTINNAVHNFQNTLDVHEYTDGLDFWLPSNVGC